MIKIVETEDGSHTIYIPEINEHYHSVHGAIQESNYIFIARGFNFSASDPVSILEIGFGTGLNVLLTALQSSATGRLVFYTTIDNNHLDSHITESLNYAQMTGEGSREIFNRIHSSPWNTDYELLPGFILRKIKGDLTKMQLSGNYDLIYFDAFSPEKQPEMWTKKIFSMISDVTVTGGVMVTYCVKGEVKRILKSSGFRISLLPGPPGKRHILRANKL